MFNHVRLMGLFVGLVASSLLVGEAEGRIPQRRAKTNGNGTMAKAQPGKNKAANKGATAQEFAELHAAKRLLEGAKHDYDGHRVKAIHDINQAIHALHGKGKGAGAGKKGNGGNKTGGGGGSLASKETQPQSDALLRQARQQLHVVHGQMRAQHHAKARLFVQAAILQIDTALKIR